MFTLLKHAISILIWAIVAAAFLIAKNPELLAFWVLLGAILVLAWVIKFVWKWIIGIFFPTVMARSYFLFVLIVLAIGLGIYQLTIVPEFNSWGATEKEMKDKYPIDDFLPNARTVAYRAITVAAPPADVYPWIKQLATEGVMTFNVNLIDLVRNKPAKFMLKDIPRVSVGDHYFIGEIVQSRENQGLTLQLNRNRFPWSKFENIYVGYYLRPEGKNETRVVMKIKADYSGFIAWFSAKYLIELGDFWVSRYQLTMIERQFDNSSA